MRNLLKQLLEKNPDNRFQTIDQVISDPWFDDVDWLKVESKENKPPFVPDIYGCYFEDDNENEDVVNNSIRPSFYGQSIGGQMLRQNLRR